LRELLRCRRKLTESQTAERNRLLKLLKDRQHQVGERRFRRFRRVRPRDAPGADRGARPLPRRWPVSPESRLRRKRADLILALDGRLEEHHRFLLAMPPRRLEAIEADSAGLDQRIGERLEPYSAPHALLMQIPGVDWVVAAVLINRDRRRHERVLERLPLERLGLRLTRRLRERRPAEERPRPQGQCPSPHHAGRRCDLRLQDQGSYLKDKHHRLKARRGALRAALAIAHKILISAYHRLFSRTCPIAISAKPISTKSARPEPSPTSNAASNASAIASPSNPMPPHRHRRPALGAVIFIAVTQFAIPSLCL
jgi:transposase